MPVSVHDTISNRLDQTKMQVHSSLYRLHLPADPLLATPRADTHNVTETLPCFLVRIQGECIYAYLHNWVLESPRSTSLQTLFFPTRRLAPNTVVLSLPVSHFVRPPQSPAHWVALSLSQFPPCASSCMPSRHLKSFSHSWSTTLRVFWLCRCPFLVAHQVALRFG